MAITQPRPQAPRPHPNPQLQPAIAGAPGARPWLGPPKDIAALGEGERSSPSRDVSASAILRLTRLLFQQLFFEDWLERKLDGLSPGIWHEVEEWPRALHDGAPRLKARDPHRSRT